MAADRDEPLLLPLPAHLHLVRDEVHVMLVQPRQLGQTDARRVEQLEHGEVACFPEPPRLRPPLRLGEQLLDLRAIQVLGKRAFQSRRASRLRGVHLQPARRVQKPVERPQRRESARGGALGEATLLHVPQPAADRQPVHAREAPPATVIGGTERGEVFYVALVRLDGMGRVVALLFQERDEVRNLGRRGHGRALESRLGRTAEAATPRPFTGKRRAASSLAILTPSPPPRFPGRRYPCPAVLFRPGAPSFSACRAGPAPAGRAARSSRSSAGSARDRRCARSGTARRASWWAGARWGRRLRAAAPG